MRYVDTDADRARWRATLAYRVLPILQAGVELNPGTDEIVPNATLFVSTESKVRPAAFLGTSSDRIGSPEGTQTVFLTVAKSLGRVPVAPYVSVAYSEWDAQWNVPFGAHVDVGHGFSLRPMYDGEETHLTASYSVGGLGVTALWVWLETPGIAVSYGF